MKADLFYIYALKDTFYVRNKIWRIEHCTDLYCAELCNRRPDLKPRIHSARGWNEAKDVGRGYCRVWVPRSATVTATFLPSLFSVMMKLMGFIMEFFKCWLSHNFVPNLLTRCC